MAQLILTRSSHGSRALHAYGSFPMTLRVGKYFLFFVMTFLIGLLSLFYLMKFTEIHTKGYKLRKLEIERNKLLTAEEIQNTNIARFRSLTAIRESEVARRMVQARNPIFIKQDGSFAKLP